MCGKMENWLVIVTFDVPRPKLGSKFLINLKFSRRNLESQTLHDDLDESQEFRIAKCRIPSSPEAKGKELTSIYDFFIGPGRGIGLELVLGLRFRFISGVEALGRICSQISLQRALRSNGCSGF